MDRTEFTQRLRRVSGESTIRIESVLGADLERALNDQGLRCYPSLSETTTGDRVRVFRAGSVVGDLIDAVLVPSADHDRDLAEAVAKVKENSDWMRRDSTPAEVVRRVLPRGTQMDYVRSLDDPDLATF